MGAVLDWKEWTSYVFLGFFAAAGLGGVYYWEHFEMVTATEPQDKQVNEPELKTGAWRLGKMTSGGARPELGNFVVYRLKGAGEELHFARVVALEGQKVAHNYQNVVVDGSVLDEKDNKTGRGARHDLPEIVVPRGCVAVLSDNRGKSYSVENDSRLLGPIPIEAIIYTFKPAGKQKD